VFRGRKGQEERKTKGERNDRGRSGGSSKKGNMGPKKKWDKGSAAT